MGKVHHAPRGLQSKIGGKSSQPATSAKEKRRTLVGLTKDSAGSFLKQRQGKKLRDLRPQSGGGGQIDGMVDTGQSASEAIWALQQEAEKRDREFQQDVAAAPVAEAEIGVNPGREAENTRRKFYVELRKVLASADVIIEVLDARDPMACRNIELEREVTSTGKRLVLLMNKIDLVPKHAVEAWSKHLKRSFPVLAFKAAHGGAKRPIHAMTSVANAPDGLLQSTHAVVGGDELMQLLKNYARMGDGSKTKAHLTVGIVGYPNTGKSSVINSMKRTCAVEVGGRAGVTKVLQEVQLDSKVTLIDSPGVVFEGASDDPSVVLRNVVRVESVSDPAGVVAAMVAKAPREALLKFYGMPRDFGHVDQFLIHVAQVRGKLKRGSGLDIPSAARSVISDWTTGKFKYYALPPASSEAADIGATAETAEVLPRLSHALDIDALFDSNASADQPVVLGAPEEQQEEDSAMECGAAAGATTTVEVDMEL